ncbi:MAG: FkbM family methyltransferase [Planctomycetota bacterium]
MMFPTLRSDTLDYSIYQHVFTFNEYRLPDRFEENDLVIDIGAHIGTFCLAAAARGSRRIVGVEAERENYELALQNLAALRQAGFVRLIHAAVWRSDENTDQVFHEGYPAFDSSILNTGGGRVVCKPGQGQPVTTLALDRLLLDQTSEHAARVRLLKIDCEGAEWPILLTSQKLHLVDEICGEFHEYGGEFDHLQPPFQLGSWRAFTAQLLCELLTGAGFEVELHRNSGFNPHHGLFFAKRFRPTIVEDRSLC